MTLIEQLSRGRERDSFSFERKKEKEERKSERNKGWEEKESQGLILHEERSERDRWPRDRGTENHSFFSLDERERKKDKEKREKVSLKREGEKKSEGKDFFGGTFT